MVLKPREELAAQQRRAEIPDCGWARKDGEDYYETGCGEEVELEHADIIANVGWVYCPHCGGVIVEESTE